MTYNLYIPPFGQIEVAESARSRRIALKIYAGGKLKITAPLKTSPKDIYDFVGQYEDKIRRAVAQAEKKAEGRQNIITFKPGVSFRTSRRRLEFKLQERKTPDNARISYDRITIFYTPETDVASGSFQQYVHKVVDAALKNEAMHYLPSRTAELAALHGLKYDHVDLRNMSTQWGSCSSNGRICLNIQLMRLPCDLIDMVILHELTHTIHMDHSKAFYADLDHYLGGRLKELNDKIKRYSTSY